MSLSTRIEPLNRELDLLLDDTLSPAARSRAFADVARDELAKAEATNARALGHVPRHAEIVDGRRGAALDTVRADGGVIVLDFELVDEVLRFIATALRAGSPVLSGAYRDSHTIFADGREVDLGGVIPAASEFVILNPLPYSRKIEIGRTESGRRFTLLVPNMLYQRTAEAALRRFGNVARIRFGFRSPVLAYGGRPSRRGGLERATRAPAIIVTAR